MRFIGDPVNREIPFVIVIGYLTTNNLGIDIGGGERGGGGGGEEVSKVQSLGGTLPLLRIVLSLII